MRRLLVLYLATMFVAACSKGEEPPAPSTGKFNAQPESGPAKPVASRGGASRAQRMYASVCAVCHGENGRGDGPGADNLNPKPRDYTDAKWQASVTDDDLKKTILLGGQGVGKSAMMPAQSQLKDDPETLDGLVTIIRGFAKK
jgi:cytochrome c oxidase cbb3-type subunit 3